MTSQTKAITGWNSLQYNFLTLAAAITAAIAATASASFGWPVWAMFIGWVAFFTRGHSAKEAFFSYLCLAAGLAFGVAAGFSVGALMPFAGPLAFGPVVFVVAILVVSLRAAPLLNNVPSYFLGLIAFFAAHIKPDFIAFVELAAVTGLGTFAAWLAHTWQTKIAQKAKN